MSPEEQRRRLDDVDASVQLFVGGKVRDARDDADRKITETRHLLRNELAALGTKVDLFAAQSTKEHAEVAGKLDRLSDDVSEMKPLAAKVAALELAAATSEAAAAAAEKLLTRQRNQFFTLAGLIVAMAGVVVAVVN